LANRWRYQNAYTKIPPLVDTPPELWVHILALQMAHAVPWGSVRHVVAGFLYLRHDTGRDRKRREARAVSELLGIARFKIHEGKLEEYKRLSAQAMEIVRTKEPGTLQYDSYFNDDQSECVVIERYRDSEAAIEHAENLRSLSEEVLAIVSVVHGEVLGEPSAELRAKLAGSEVPRLFMPFMSK
jgi:quinol monooxygenase YgiN